MTTEKILVAIRNYRASITALRTKAYAGEIQRMETEVKKLEQQYFDIVGVYPTATEIIGTSDYIGIKLRYDKWVFRRVFFEGLTTNHIHINYLGKSMSIWRQGYSFQHNVMYIQYHAVNPSDLDWLLNAEV